MIPASLRACPPSGDGAPPAAREKRVRLGRRELPCLTGMDATEDDASRSLCSRPQVLTSSPEGGLNSAAMRRAALLTAGAHKANVSPAGLGAVAYAKAAVAHARRAKPGTAIPLGVSVQGAAVRTLVDSLAKRFDRDPIDSKVLLRDLKPFVTEGESG